MEERRQIVNLVFQNASMNGEKLSYTIAEPFNLLQNLGERPKWGQLLDLFMNREIELKVNINILKSLMLPLDSFL